MLIKQWLKVFLGFSRGEKKWRKFSQNNDFWLTGKTKKSKEKKKTSFSVFTVNPFLFHHHIRIVKLFFQTFFWLAYVFSLCVVFCQATVVVFQLNLHWNAHGLQYEFAFVICLCDLPDADSKKAKHSFLLFGCNKPFIM